MPRTPIQKWCNQPNSSATSIADSRVQSTLMAANSTRSANVAWRERSPAILFKSLRLVVQPLRPSGDQASIDIAGSVRPCVNQKSRTAIFPDKILCSLVGEPVNKSFNVTLGASQALFWRDSTPIEDLGHFDCGTKRGTDTWR